MLKTITRNTVIKALKTEELTRGDFFRPLYLTPGKVNTKNCSVCAVGAVLRTAGLVKGTQLHKKLFNLGEIVTNGQYSSGQDINQLLKDKNYLGALSAYFESNFMGSKSKRNLLRFVRRNFPFYIKFNV